MEIITQNFTYDLPDVYLGSTTEDGLTGTVSYHGPDTMWVFVDAKTGKLNWGMHCIIDHDDDAQEIANLHAGEDHRAILVSFTQNPLICWAMFGEYDEETASEKTYTLDGETEPYFTHFDPIPPHEVYDYDSFTYLIDQGQWKTPYPMRKPQRTQEEFTDLLAELIADIERDIAAEEVDAENTALMEAYKTKVEALSTTYSDVPWYMWPIPPAPELGDPNKEIVDESERMIGDSEWDSAEDGSEGPGVATNYQPDDDTNMLPDDADEDSKPAPESDSIDDYTDDGLSGEASSS